jgi:hypothetical protein
MDRIPADLEENADTDKASSLAVEGNTVLAAFVAGLPVQGAVVVAGNTVAGSTLLVAVVANMDMDIDMEGDMDNHNMVQVASSQVEHRPEDPGPSQHRRPCCHPHSFLDWEIQGHFQDSKGAFLTLQGMAPLLGRKDLRFLPSF